jgi:hypothetical protein
MRPPRSILRVILVVVATLASAPAIAPAQTDSFADLQTAIERNAELLAQAEALVRQTNSVKARAALDAARKLHEGSQRLLREDRPRIAAVTVKEAREAILRAIAIARREVKLESNAIRTIERAGSRLEQARSSLDEYGGRDDGAPGKLVEEAGVQLQRSRDNMQEHMFEVALHLAKASEELSSRALRMMKAGGVSPGRVRREIGRTDDVIARAQERASGNRAVLEEAIDIQRRAKENARSGRLRLALEQTARARDIALRLLKSAGASGELSEESAGRALAFTDEVLDRARRYASENQLDEALGRVAEAERVQDEAKSRYRERRLQPAMRMTLRARNMAKDAVRGALDKPIDVGDVRAALARTDETLRRLEEALAGSDNDAARELHDRAARRQDEARESLDAGEPRKALALTKVARNLAAKALRVLDGEND